MNLDNVTVNIIRRARRTKLSPVIHAIELRYVFQHHELNAIDKLVWGYIACLSAFDESLGCTITIGLTAMILKLSKDEILDSLLHLKDKEFLRLGFNMKLDAIADIKPFLRMVERPDDFLSKINSVHCQLLLPRLGLIDLLANPVPIPKNQMVVSG